MSISTRVCDAFKVGLTAASLLPSAALWAQGAGVAVSPACMEAAVHARYPELGHVQPLVEVRARSTEPALVVGAPEHWGASDVRVRMSCRQPGECLPFYVTATRTGTAAAELSPAPRPGAPRSNTAPTQTVRAGTAATLLIDEGHLHLRFPVTVLGAAPVGGEVRVQARPAPLSPGSHPQTQVLVATVVDSATVRGQLP